MTEADPGVVRLDAEYCARLLPRRDPSGHKFTFGTVIALAGSLDYAGAALMTAVSAVRGGAGLVTIAIPDSLRPVFAGRVPEAILLALPEHGDAVVDPGPSADEILVREPSAIVAGPGLKETDANRLLLMELLSRSGSPVVVDAGAINLLVASGTWWTRVACAVVLTPHVGEFERLTGAPVGRSDGERQQVCEGAAIRFRQVVVLKGAHTVVAAPDGRVAVAPFANPALATAGSGDVLAGLIGALLAQGLKPFDAACLGVFLHGTAGERISERLGDSGLLASDLPYEIAMARHELARKRVD